MLKSITVGNNRMHGKSGQVFAIPNWEGDRLTPLCGSPKEIDDAADAIIEQVNQWRAEAKADLENSN